MSNLKFVAKGKTSFFLQRVHFKVGNSVNRVVLKKI